MVNKYLIFTDIDFLFFIRNNNSCKRFLNLKKKYLLVFYQMEPKQIANALYGDIIKNINKYKNFFDIIITFDEEILKLSQSVFHLPYFGRAWVPDSPDLKKKEFIISYLTTRKNLTPAHKLRINIWNKQNLIIIPKKMFVSYNCPTDKIFENNILMKKGSGKKILFDGIMFSIIIENSDQNNYITEKLLDCLIQKTIPIFWGCKNIDKFFNTKGFIKFKDENDIFNIINNLTEDDYYSRIEYIEENYKIASCRSNIPNSKDHLNKILNNSDHIFFHDVFLKLTDHSCEYLEHGKSTHIQ